MCYEEFGLTRTEYERLTPREFDLMIDGLERRRKEKSEEIMEGWRIARFQAFTALQPHLKKEHANLSIYDFMPLPGDPTPQERKKMKAIVHEETMDKAASILKKYRTLKAKQVKAENKPAHKRNRNMI